MLSLLYFRSLACKVVSSRCWIFGMSDRFLGIFSIKRAHDWLRSNISDSRNTFECSRCLSSMFRDTDIFFVGAVCFYSLSLAVLTIWNSKSTIYSSLSYDLLFLQVYLFQFFSNRSLITYYSIKITLCYLYMSSILQKWNDTWIEMSKMYLKSIEQTKNAKKANKCIK